MSVDDDVRAAAHACVVRLLADAKHEIEQMHAALESRAVIGQAQGILMERLSIDPDAAFDDLKRTSSHMNRKVSAIAEEIIRTRELPVIDR